MKTVELTCIRCPMGCRIQVQVDGDKVISVEGNTCKRGDDYARTEVVAPVRTVTSTVRIKNAEHPVIPVKTTSEIPKSMIFKVMEEINRAETEAPASIGDVVIYNVCGTGADVVCTANMSACK